MAKELGLVVVVGVRLLWPNRAPACPHDALKPTNPKPSVFGQTLHVKHGAPACPAGQRQDRVVLTEPPRLEDLA